MKKAFIILFLAVWISTASAQGPGTRSAGGCVAASSSGTTYTCNFTVDPGTYVTHQAYFVTADIANTGAVTWNVNSHGAKSVVKMIGGATTALVANDIRAGQELLLVYDGANLQVLSGIGNIPVAIHGFGASFDGGVAALTAGKTVYTTVPYACAIKAWNITVSPADTATFDIWRLATGAVIPTLANTILGTPWLAISTGTSVHSTTLSAFTSTAIAANDIIGINLKSIGGAATYANLSVECDQ